MTGARPRVVVADSGSGNLRSIEKVLVAVGHGGGALRQAVLEVIRSGRPFFGICVGMQLLFESSEESPGAVGLGILPGRVRRFAARPGLKIPHMGWNRTSRGPAHSTSVRDVPDGDFFYFVHSYYPDPARPE